MIFLLLLIFLFAEVKPTDIQKNLTLALPSILKLNEVVEIKPIENHIINIEAPNDCGSSGRLVSKSKSSLFCQAVKPGEDTYNIYICDAAKTFCKQQELKIKTESPEGLKNWFNYYWERFTSQQVWKSPSKIKDSPNASVLGFTQNQVVAAFQRAKTESKPLLLFYTQKYCPPCKLVKETSLLSSNFQNFGKSFVLLQLDGDIDTEDGFIKEHNLLYTPTFIFFNSNGEELDRKIDYISPEGFRSWWDLIKNYEGISFLINKNNQELTHDEKVRLYKWYLASQQFEKAKHLFSNYEEGLKRVDELIPIYWSKDKMTHEEKLKYIYKIFSLKGLSCSDFYMDEAASVLESLTQETETVDAVKQGIDSSFKKIIQFYAQKVLAKPSEVTCYVKQFYQELSYFNYIKHFADKKLVDAQSQKLSQMLEHFPKLEGTNPIESIDLYKGYVLDRDQHYKSLEKLSEKNPEDFSYDFLAAMHEFGEKNEPNYKKALVYIDKTLARAKGRIWEKAIKLKIQILIKMHKKDEARKLIASSLSQTVLPVDDKILIHRFVQNLRDLEREIDKK